jgi:hypothetical protein
MMRGWGERRAESCGCREEVHDLGTEDLSLDDQSKELSLPTPPSTPLSHSFDPLKFLLSSEPLVPQLFRFSSFLYHFSIPPMFPVPKRAPASE